MDQFGSLDLVWTQGYNGQKLFYIDKDVICYQCGLNVKFLIGNDSQTVFAFNGHGVGPLAVHRVNKHFAIAERCLGPKIFVYEYPTFKELVVLKDAAQMELQALLFSSSSYMLSLSGLPDFELIFWNYIKGERLISASVSPEPPTSLSFNPANWRQFTYTTKDSLVYWHIEQSNDTYALFPQKLRLPPEDPLQEYENEKEQDSFFMRPFSYISKYTVTIPRTAISGLVGEMADQLEEFEDTITRVSPTVQAWTPTGDIFIGCLKGHILKVNGDTFKVTTVYYPPAEILNYFSGNESSLPMPDISHQKDSEDVTSLSPKSGSMNCLGLHRYGLFAAGEDGMLRLFEITHDEVRVVETIRTDVPITSFVFSSTFKELILGSRKGKILTLDIGKPESLRLLSDMHYGEFVSVGVLPADSNICVSLKFDGMLQAWTMDTGFLVSCLSIQEMSTAFASSPLCHFVVVGTADGFLYFVDFSNVKEPRIVHRIRLYSGPVRQLVFDQDGLYLITGGEDENIFILNGFPSSNFTVLGYIVADGVLRNIATYVTPERTVHVAVTVNTVKRYKDECNQIIRFDITDDLIKDLSNSYKNLKCELKDKEINKMVLFLIKPSLGIALGEGSLAYTIALSSRKINTLIMPEVKPKKKDAPELFLTSQTEHAGHQLPGGQVLLSPHLKWLASFGPDGALILRTIGDMDRTLTIKPHDYRNGGIKVIAFSEDCHKIFTTGFDGVLCCYQFSKLKSVPRRMSSSYLREQENSYLQNMPNWQFPPPLSRPVSAIQRERLEKAQRMKKEALENEEIYRTPTPEPLANCTWLEEKEVEDQQMEEKQYADTKRQLREHIRDIRKMIQDMMKENAQLPDIEKLSRHEFDLDIEEQGRLQMEGEAEIEKVREKIEYENLAKLYLREVIKKECWDDMAVKGRSILAFNSQLEVANFPLRERTHSFLKHLQTVTARRKLEIRELEFRRKELEPTTKTSEEEIGENEEEQGFKEQPSLTGSLGALYGGGNELFYSQFEMHLRHQKMNQIVFLQDAIYRIKDVFNKEFDEVFAKKEQEISKIKEKNKRIVKILSDIDLDEPVFEPTFSVLEKPELLLTVEDSEVTVEKFLTPEQQKKLEEQQKLEEERRLREKGDNQRERALEKMMGGVLEIRKEDELKKDIPIPLFMQQREATDWTEEEKKLAIDYERRVKELNEEREKYRKQLETELRKLQSVIKEGMAAFDEVLNQLFLKKIKVVMVLYQEELKILRLRYNLLMEEELETREHELNFKLEHKKKLKHLMAETVTLAKAHVEAFRNQYDIVVAEDKVMDKAFKREFLDVSSIMCDHLYKLFRKRPRGFKFKGADTPQLDAKSPNPFSDRPSTARQNAQAKAALEAALDDLDKPSNMPDGLDPSVWHRMCNYRRAKIECENLMKQKALMMAEMQAFLQKRQEEDDTLKNEIEDITGQLTKLKEDQLRFTLNLEVQLLLKQGQVEVDESQFIKDYSNSVLIHRSVVEDLNATIKQLGESKIASMVESKDFRKGIIQLEWEHKKMSMQMEDLENKMKDIQFMKVTREIQAYLNETDYEAKKAAEIATLEQTIILQKKFHEKNMADKKQVLVELKSGIRQRQSSNAVLDVELRDLNVAVNERRHIDEVNADRKSDTGAEKRYQDIIQRRKLVDLAKAQAQEVAVLRAEVERLRMRTFPALVQVEH